MGSPGNQHFFHDKWSPLLGKWVFRIDSWKVCPIFWGEQPWRWVSIWVFCQCWRPHGPCLTCNPLWDTPFELNGSWEFYVLAGAKFHAWSFWINQIDAFYIHNSATIIFVGHIPNFFGRICGSIGDILNFVGIQFWWPPLFCWLLLVHPFEGVTHSQHLCFRAQLSVRCWVPTEVRFGEGVPTLW